MSRWKSRNNKRDNSFLGMGVIMMIMRIYSTNNNKGSNNNIIIKIKINIIWITTLLITYKTRSKSIYSGWTTQSNNNLSRIWEWISKSTTRIMIIMTMIIKIRIKRIKIKKIKRMSTNKRCTWHNINMTIIMTCINNNNNNKKLLIVIKTMAIWDNHWNKSTCSSNNYNNKISIAK